MVIETRDNLNREHNVIYYIISGMFLRLKCPKNHFRIGLVALGGALVPKITFLAQKSMI